MPQDDLVVKDLFKDDSLVVDDLFKEDLVVPNLFDTQKVTTPDTSVRTDPDLFKRQVDKAALNILKAVPAGAISGIENYVRSARLLERLTGQNFGFKSAVDFLSESADYFRPDEEGGFVERSLSGGIESTLQSLISGIPGAVIGAVVTAPSGPGALAGTVAGYATSAGTIFSLAEYDRFMEEIEDTILEFGGTSDDVKRAQGELVTEGIISALAEGGFEALSDVLQAKAFKLIGAKGLSYGAKQGLKNFIAKFVKSYAAEAPTELATGLVQNWMRERAQKEVPELQVEPFSKQFADILGTVAVQSMLFSGAAQTRENVLTKRGVEKAQSILNRSATNISAFSKGQIGKLTTEEEDDLIFATQFMRQAGVPYSKNVEDALKKYASQEIDIAEKQIADLREDLTDPDNTDDTVLEELEKLSLRLQKMAAITMGVDTGLLTKALQRLDDAEELIPDDLADKTELEGFPEAVQREAIEDAEKILTLEEEETGLGIEEAQDVEREIVGEEVVSEEPAGLTEDEGGLREEEIVRTEEEAEAKEPITPEKKSEKKTKESIEKTPESISKGRPKKLIGGVQTGADQATEVADELGMEKGGTAPAGFLTEKGEDRTLAKKFNVEEDKKVSRTAKPAERYRSRTKQNIENADGTVLFGDRNSRGSQLTVNESKRQGKPIIVNPTPEQLRKFVIDNNIETLNVAGNRESVTPGIKERAKDIIRKAFPKQETRISIEEKPSKTELEEKTRKAESALDQAGREFAQEQYASNEEESGSFDETADHQTTEETVETNRDEESTDENDSTELSNKAIRDYQSELEGNSIVDTTQKLNNLIEQITGEEHDPVDIILDAKGMTESKFVKKYQEMTKTNDEYKLKLRKIYQFTKGKVRRENRFIFSVDKRGNVTIKNNKWINSRRNMPSEWTELSVADIILKEKGIDYFWSAGNYEVGRWSANSISDYEANRKYSEKGKKWWWKDKLDAMWRAGQYVLIMRSAQGQSEIWVKNMFPKLKRVEASKKTRQAVLKELGFDMSDLGANVLKRAQIVLYTGAVSEVSKSLGRKTKAYIVPESKFGVYDGSEVFEFDDKAKAERFVNNLTKEGTNARIFNLHDGAIYVSESFLNKYLDALGLDYKNKGSFKSFIWHKTPKGTFAGKGHFFVATKGSPEYALLEKYKTDMLVYEDASKLNAQHNTVIELPDESIRFHGEEPEIRDNETFTRSTLNLMPMSFQKFYNNFLADYIFKFEALSSRLNRPNGIYPFLNKAFGITKSPIVDAFKKIVLAKPELHPYILGTKRTDRQGRIRSVDNPFKRHLVSFIRDRVLKMPRNGFHTVFRPSEEVTILSGDKKKRRLNWGEISIPAKVLNRKGLKIGDKIIVQRSPLIKADSNMVMTIVSTHGLGNSVMMNSTQYQIFSTGDYDGDTGAVIVPEPFEAEFFESIEAYTGDINLDQYKEKKKETVLSSEDLVNMITRNSAGKVLIGHVANTSTIYHWFNHNKVGVVVYDDNSVEYYDLNKPKFSKKAKYYIRPKFWEKEDSYLDSHSIIGRYHLAATDQAKEDVLFSMSKKATGITEDTIIEKDPEKRERLHSPTLAMVYELFDVYEVGNGSLIGKDKQAVIETLEEDASFQTFRNLLSSFSKGEDGNAWIYDDLINNIEAYYRFIKTNGLFGNTQLEKFLLNVWEKAFDVNIAENPNSLERKAMLDSHRLAMLGISKSTKYNKKALGINAKTENVLNSLAREIEYAYMNEKNSYSDAAKITLDLISEANLSKKQKMYLSFILMNSKKTYDELTKLRVIGVEQEFLNDYFSLYNRQYKKIKSSFSNKSKQEITKKKQESLPEYLKYKPCYD